MMKKVLVMVLAASGLGAACAATTVSATTPEFRLSIRHDGVRASAGEETLRFSNLWDGDTNATVTIRQDGVVLTEGLTGEGDRPWSVARNGTYALTHTTYTNGVVAKVENATFVVTGKDIPFPTEGEETVSVTGYEGEYDGAGHGVTVSAPGVADLQVRYARSANGPYVAQAPLFTNVVSVTTVWCELSAPGYVTQTNSATVVIAKRPVTLTSPTKTKKYDGTVLTFGAEEIVATYVGSGGQGLPALPEGETFAFSNFASIPDAGEKAATFTYGAGSGMDLANYSVSVVSGTLTVTKATVGGGASGEEPGTGTVPADGLSKFDATAVYDGEGHTMDTNALYAAFAPMRSGGTPLPQGWEREAFAFATAESGPWQVEVPAYTNAGTYVVWYRFRDPNYEDFVHAAKVTITKATLDPPVLSDLSYTGVMQTVHVPANDLYSVTYNPGGVSVGTYMVMLTLTDGMNWKWADAATDYVMLWYKITFAANVWTVQPRISGWIYGEAPGVPEAAAKFGAVSVTYRGQADDGTVYETASAVTKAGSYTAVFTVAETADYAGLSAEVPFTVSPRPIVIVPPGDPNVPPRGVYLVVTNYAGVYDGAGHGIGVALQASDAAEVDAFSLAYAPSETGSWSEELPLYTNVVTTSVWYRVSAPNYTPFTDYTTVTIAPRPIANASVSVPDVLYTGAALEPPVAVSDVVGGVDIVTPGDYTAVYSDNVAVGTATVTLTGHGNYAGTATATFEIYGHPLTEERVTLASGPFVYDGAAQRPTVTVRDESGAVVPAADNYLVTYADNVDAGTGSVTVTGTNTWIGSVTLPFVIAKRPVTLQSADATWTYDTMAHAAREVAVTEGSFVAEEGVVPDPASFPSITDAGTCANAFKWTFAAGTRAANYDVTTRFGTLTVNLRPIADDVRNWDIRLDKDPMYNGQLQHAPVIQVCFVKPDGNLDHIPHTLGGDTAVDAGNYTLTITGQGNYTGSTTKTWAIMPRNVRLTSGSGEWTYDGAAHSQTAVTATGDGFVAGEGATYADFPVVRHVADAATPVANTFTYALTGGTKAGNYMVTTAFGTVRMLRRPVTLTAPTKTKAYDGTPLTFGAAEIGVAHAGSGGQGLPALPAGESFAFANFASITEAGKVAASYKLADGTARLDDYAITQVPGVLTVTKSAAEITVTAQSASWVYDGAEHRLEAFEATNLGALVAGDELEVSFDAASVVTAPSDGTVENRITAVRVVRTTGGQRQDVTANYTLSWYPGELKVTRRPVTLTSKSDTKVYDGTPLTAHEVTVGGDGFVGADGATFAYTGTQTEKGTSDNAFTYALKAGTDGACYDITTVNGTLEVTAADITDATDGDWQVVLGPALTYTGLAQVQTVASATFSGLPLDYSVTGNQQTDAGSYEMTITGQGNFSGTHTVAWAIRPRPLTLTAGSGSKVYDGTALTAGTVTAVGFVAGEGAAYTCDGAQAGVGASANGVATITWNANTKGSNYAVTKVLGTLAVTPRPVTVTSANISKPYDGTPLRLTAGDISLDGGQGPTALPAGESFVYGNFAERTEAGQTRATFTIAAGTGTDLANYTITPVYGTITIAKSATEIGVTAKSRSWTYDGETHVLNEYEATNLSTLQAGDELVVSFDEKSKVTTPRDGPNGDGKVANTIRSVRVVRNGTEDVTTNYTIGIYPGTLSVLKRPITVTISGCSDTITYDGTEHSVSGYDISTTDTLYNVDAMTVFKGMDLAVRTDVGTTYMDLNPGIFINRDMNFDVTYAVRDGSVTIEPADITQGKDNDFVLTLGPDPKYNGTVQTIPVEAVTYKGLPVTYTLAGENATHAGTYTLTVKANGNFTGEKSTTWRILKRDVTLTSGSATRPYNGKPLVNGSVTVTGDGFIGVEGATFDVTGSQTSAGSRKNTFTYALKAGTKAENYDITAVEGDLAVTKATYPGTISWNVAADAATWMYDGQVHGVALTGVPAGVTAHVTGNVAKDAGSYMATATLAYDAANYVAPVAPAPLAWTIAKRPVTLMAASKDKPYDGFPLEVKPGDITASGSGYAPGECFDYFDRASITDVGETPATFAYRDSATAKVSNYEVSVKGGQTLKVTVGADQVSVTADSAAWAYDGDEHRQPTWTAFNADKLLAGHAFDVRIADTSVVTTPKDGPSGDGVVSNVFEYVRIVDAQTGANVTRNYNLVVKAGTLQVTNAWIAAGRLAGADRVAKTYDGRATNVVVTADLLQPATVRYFADGRTGRAALPAGAVFRDEPYAFTDAATYEVWYTVEADYYNTYTGTVEVAIAKRPVTLTSPTKAKAYDGRALTFGAGEVVAAYVGSGGQGLPALPAGESFRFSDFASITDVGRVAATFAYAAGPGTRLSNYDVTVAPGTLTVNASAEEITVTAKSGSWPYDGETHVLHACTVENAEVLKPGDELVVAYDPASAATTPDDGEVENRIVSVKIVRGGVRQPDGTLAGGTDVTRNYSVAAYPGTLRVTNAAVTFGDLDPADFSTEAVYDGETHTVAVTAPTLLTAPVAVTYCGPDGEQWKTDPKAVGARDAGAYTVRYRISAKYYDDFIGEATVTIRPRPVTLVSANAQRAYNGQPLRRDIVTVKDGSLDFVAGEGVAATCTGGITDVGGMENLFDYVFTGGAKADNYAITKEYGWLRVTPAKLDATRVLGADPIAFSWTYDGTAHAFVVEPNLDESFRIYYALKPNDEGAFAEEPPTFTDAMSEPVPVHFKIVSPNFEPFYGSGTAVVGKCPVAEPSIPTKVYTGERQVADVPKSPLYAVLSNGGGVDVGTYRVRLQLVDAQNYRWESTSSSSFFAKFDIVQGANEWTVLPAITGWTEGATANDPVAAARFGEVVVTYCGTTADGVSVIDAPAVTQAGTYTAVFTVEASESWTGLREEVVFTVVRSRGGGAFAPLAYTARGYSGVYDGKGHSISLEVTGGDGHHTVSYARAETGPWQAENFVFTEACRETVWFRITSANYGEVVGTVTVTITGGGTSGPTPAEALAQLELGHLDVVDGRAILELKKTVKGVWYGFSGADALPGPFEPMPETFVEGTGGELRLVAPLRTPKQGFYRVRVQRTR